MLRVHSKIKELESVGFLKREEVRENGKFSGYNFRMIVPTVAEKTVAGKTAAVNPHQSNIYNIQEEVSEYISILCISCAHTFSPEIYSTHHPAHPRRMILKQTLF